MLSVLTVENKDPLENIIKRNHSLIQLYVSTRLVNTSATGQMQRGSVAEQRW